MPERRVLPPPASPIHILGIGGVGMSALALLLKPSFAVSGSDLRPSPITDALQQAHVPVAFGAPDRPDHPALVAIRGAALLVHPPQIPPSHPALLCARDAQVPAISRDTALALLLQGRLIIGVSGFARRSLTAALIADVLPGCGLFAGILRRDAAPHARIGQTMAVELDEFLDFSPFSTADALVVTAPPKPNIQSKINIYPLDSISHGFALSPNGQGVVGDVEHEDPHETVLKLHTQGAPLATEQNIELKVPPGSDMAAAATAAAAYLHLCQGLDLSEIAPKLSKAARNLIGHFEVVSVDPLRVHDVRTYPHTVTQSIADIMRLGARHPLVLFRPYPPTFDAFPLGAWVAVFGGAFSVAILPDYHDQGAPRAAALRAALGRAPLGREPDALIAFGGDDMRALLDSDKLPVYQ